MPTTKKVFDRSKFDYSNILVPLSNKKLTKYDFIGFDIETYGDTNEFYLGGLYYFTDKLKEKPKYELFFDKEEMAKHMLSEKFKGKYIVATNLGFDFSGVFYDTKYWNDFNKLEQQGKLLYCSLKSDNSDKKGKNHFIDTLNYVPFSVEKLGTILKIPKLEKPKCLGKLPKNDEEKEELIIYNKRDCEISCLFMYFLQDAVHVAGGNLKITIASTAFDIWRRNFQEEELVKEEYILKDKNIKKFIFKGYYGGRTEVFKRGCFKNLYYYDINSLYPSVMINNFPLPQSVKKIDKTDIVYIENYEGVSECSVTCPNINKPFLPYAKTKKDKNGKEKKIKLLFPGGKFKGVWNNNELRYAIKLGYKINKIHSQIIYTETFNPFNKFVNYFYNLRLEYKRKGSPMELPMKSILNNLYGKFVQNVIKEFDIIDMKNYGGDIQELYDKIGDDFLIKDDKIIISKEKDYNGKNTYPIIGSYVTSYARIKMYEYINNDDVVYTDTDSVFIETNKYDNSKELGDMKLEDTIKFSIFVKPKFYYTINSENKKNIKIKGLNKAEEKDFYNILSGSVVHKEKFTKIRESARRGMKPNTKIILPKLMSLIDDKREWYKEDKNDIIELSKPIILTLE